MLKQTIIRRIIFPIVVVTVLISTGWGYWFYSTLFIPSCGATTLKEEERQYFNQIGEKFSLWLDETGAKLVIAGRRGQNLEKHGMHYSHLAFIKKEAEGWFAYHLLNECPSDRGGLHKEALVHFFKVTKPQHEVAVVVPKPYIQAHLSLFLESELSNPSFFQPAYSAVAYPYAHERQNSNGWILEVYTQALDHRIRTREEAFLFLQAHNYQPMKLEAGHIYQWLSKTFIPNISLEGHSKKELAEGKVAFNSAESVLNFISQTSIPIPNCYEDFPLGGENVCEVFNPLKP